MPHLCTEAASTGKESAADVPVFAILSWKTFEARGKVELLKTSRTNLNNDNLAIPGEFIVLTLADQNSSASILLRRSATMRDQAYNLIEDINRL